MLIYTERIFFCASAAPAAAAAAAAGSAATAIAPSLSASIDSGIAMCARARPGADAVSRTCGAEHTHYGTNFAKCVSWSCRILIFLILLGQVNNHTDTRYTRFSLMFVTDFHAWAH